MAQVFSSDLMNVDSRAEFCRWSLQALLFSQCPQFTFPKKGRESFHRPSGHEPPKSLEKWQEVQKRKKSLRNTFFKRKYRRAHQDYTHS